MSTRRGSGSRGPCVYTFPTGHAGRAGTLALGLRALERAMTTTAPASPNSAQTTRGKATENRDQVPA